MRFASLSLLLSLWLLSPVVQADSLERFRSFLRDTKSGRADFEQKVVGREGRVTQESKGSFVFVRPGRFRWTYDKPVDQLIVGDGERVWIYDRELNQVTVRKISRALGSTPAALLSGASDVEKAFALSDAGASEGVEWLEAKPREPEAGFDRIRMGFSAKGLEAMELVDNFGQTTRLRFLNLQRNPKIDPAELRFEPPKGADILGEK
jgi:outer membrane lipoprotein carrier protein